MTAPFMEVTDILKGEYNMNDRLKELLDEKIEAALNALDKFDAGTNEYGAAVDDVCKLYKLKNDEEKAVMDDSEKRRRREMEVEQFERDLECRKAETQLKRDQLTEQTREHNCDANFHERELRSKEIQVEQQKLVDYIKLGAEITGIVLPLMFYGHWMKKGFEFEQTGRFSSDTFRGLFMKFKPTKK